MLSRRSKGLPAGSACPCVPNKIRFWNSLFPVMSKTQLLSPFSQLYFPFFSDPVILWPFNCSLNPWGLGSLCFSRTLHITSGKHLPCSHVSNCNISFGLATECAQYNCVLAFSPIECVTFRQNYIFRSPWAI